MSKVQSTNIIYPPNKILKRKTEISRSSVIYDHLLFLDFNRKKHSLVSSSNLNGTLWEGYLLYFEDEQHLQDLQFTKIYKGSTASDGKFLNDDTIVLAEDDGYIKILKCSQGKNIDSVRRFKEVDRVPRISVWDNETQFLSCSENTVTVWDVKREKPNHRFKNYHTEFVNCVDTIKSDPNVFVSTGADLKCVIWDIRNQNPASVLYKSCEIQITGVSCNPQNTNCIVIGKENGDVCLIDKRNSLNVVSSTNCNFYVHRLLFNEFNKLAVCGDTNKVVVWECENNFSSVYNNDSKHVDIVRGLGWNKADLYTCGLEKQIVKHSI